MIAISISGINITMFCFFTVTSCIYYGQFTYTCTYIYSLASIVCVALNWSCEVLSCKYCACFSEDVPWYMGVSVLDKSANVFQNPSIDVHEDFMAQTRRHSSIF